MSNIRILIEWFLLASYFIFTLLMLCLAIVYRKSLEKAIPLFSMFLIALFLGFEIKSGIEKRKNKASKKYLGYYKLNILDRKECVGCKVKLFDDYHYDILVGAWLLEMENGNYRLKVMPGTITPF